MTDALENGDLWWLRTDGKHATIGYAPKSKEEIVEVVRLVPLEFIRQRLVEQIDDAATTGRGRNGRGTPDNSPEAYLREYHRFNLYRMIIRTILQEKGDIHCNITIWYTNLCLCIKS